MSCRKWCPGWPPEVMGTRARARAWRWGRRGSWTTWARSGRWSSSRPPRSRPSPPRSMPSTSHRPPPTADRRSDAEGHGAATPAIPAHASDRILCLRADGTLRDRPATNCWAPPHPRYVEEVIAVVRAGRRPQETQLALVRGVASSVDWGCPTAHADSHQTAVISVGAGRARDWTNDRASGDTLTRADARIGRSPDKGEVAGSIPVSPTSRTLRERLRAGDSPFGRVLDLDRGCPLNTTAHR